METLSLNFTHLEAVLEEYGRVARDDYKEYLKEGQKNTMNANLYNSVEFEVQHRDRTYLVNLNLLDYWKYVEGGTKGAKYPNAKCRQHIPPHLPILEWIKVKPVIPKPMENGKLPTPEQLSYAIARGIGKNGIKPFPAMQQTMDETFKMFEEKIMDAWYQDVGDSIDLELHMFGEWL